VGLLDGAGEPRFVAETVDLQPGRLDDVTPAFAWDEGEDDRTLEAWLDGHRSWAAQLGQADAEPFEVLFERFRVVWPEPDRTVWLRRGCPGGPVRRARRPAPSLRASLRQRRGGGGRERWAVDALPALAGRRDGRILRCRSGRPDGEVLTFGDVPDAGVAARLRQAWRCWLEHGAPRR
jgi:hypothetical protein